MASASWKLCSMSGLQTPSASAEAKSLSSCGQKSERHVGMARVSGSYVAREVLRREGQLAGHGGGGVARRLARRRLVDGGSCSRRRARRRIAGYRLLPGRRVLARRRLPVVVVLLLVLPRGRDLRPAQCPRLTCCETRRDSSLLFTFVRSSLTQRARRINKH